VDLFGYDPRIQGLFDEVISRLKLIDQSIYTQTLYSTQSDILGLQAKGPPYVSAQLGNEVRNTCYLLAGECKCLMDEAIAPFSKEMIKLIKQRDRQIVGRRIKVSSVQKLYPTSLEQLKQELANQIADNLSQKAHANIDGTQYQPDINSPLVVPLITCEEPIGIIERARYHEALAEIFKEFIGSGDIDRKADLNEQSTQPKVAKKRRR
jgi:hypothetical protein